MVINTFATVSVNGNLSDPSVKCCYLTLAAGAYILFANAAFNFMNPELGATKSVYIVSTSTSLPEGSTFYGFGASNGTGGWSSCTSSAIAVLTSPAEFCCIVMQNAKSTQNVSCRLCALKIK